jgi:homoserine kinase
VLDGHNQRGLVPAVASVHLGASVQQHPDNAAVPLLGGQVQRRSLVSRNSGVDLGRFYENFVTLKIKFKIN